MQEVISISDEEATLIQKAAEGAALVMSFDPKEVDEATRKEAMDLYGSVLLEGLLQCPSFISKVETELAKILAEKEAENET